MLLVIIKTSALPTMRPPVITSASLPLSAAAMRALEISCPGPQHTEPNSGRPDFVATLQKTDGSGRSHHQSDDQQEL